jgi:uncharacterized protein YyaL (SSP411 family)
MGDAYRGRRADAEDNALALVDGLGRVDEHYRRGARAADPAGLTASLIITAGRQLAERCDQQHGGLGGAPKFPSSSSHDLLARASRLPFGAAAREAFEGWARGMAEGGIYDHLGGGFARYSVDAKWLVPHFEKMLYDQAQLLGIYAAAVAMGESAAAAGAAGDTAAAAAGAAGDTAAAAAGAAAARQDAREPAAVGAGSGAGLAARAREVIEETVAFLVRELSDPGGGLWSSLDADSEGEEGKFYVWTPAELRTALGRSGAMLLGPPPGAPDGGTSAHGASVLSRVTPRTSPAEEEHLAELRQKLLAARDRRVRPGTDDKVLAGWNGLAISGLCAAWRATGHGPALTLALRVAGFLRDRMIRGAAVARVYHEGATKDLDGTLDDYAFCGAALLELAEATGDRAWWDLGAGLLGTVREKFVAEEDGVVVFYLAPAGDPLLVHRPESHHDGAIPSGAAAAVAGLVRLGAVAGDEAALRLAERYLVQRLTGATGVNAWATSALLGALDLYLHPQVLVVTEGAGREALIAAARRTYAPTLCVAGAWAAASVLEGKTPAEGGVARAFVCTGPVCSAPVTEPAALHALLHAVHQ